MLYSTHKEQAVIIHTRKAYINAPPNHVVAQPLSIVVSTDTVKLATWVVMEQCISSIWCLLPLVAGMLSGCCSEGQMGEFCLFNGNYSTKDL